MAAADARAAAGSVPAQAEVGLASPALPARDPTADAAQRAIDRCSQLAPPAPAQGMAREGGAGAPRAAGFAGTAEWLGGLELRAVAEERAEADEGAEASSPK